jgi:NAD(P)-dependent dehydrogenase (short-subunit alcohol dehydrogenase family)
MDLGLSGKTVIVTGGSGGIGRGLVQGFAAEGSQVVIATRDEEKGREVAEATEPLPGSALVVATDVTDGDAVQAMVQATLERFGSIDALVNNAGGTRRPQPFVEVAPGDWDWEIDLNVRGVLQCTRAVASPMLARGRGSIVNITSNSALLGEAAQGVANYAGAKGYVEALSRALAWEWGPAGVRVNCIAPGWIVPWKQEHPGAGSFWNRFGFELFGTPEEMARQAESGTLPSVQSQPLRRLGRPEDVAHLAVFLASDCASHLTGQHISVSGGAYMP